VSITLDISYITNTGLKRQINEDSLLVGETIISLKSFENKQLAEKIDAKLGCFMVVADGMGGHGKGEIASGIIIKTFFENTSNINSPQDIEQILHNAKLSLDKYVTTNSEALNFGAVIAGMYVKDNQAIVFNCGDSRVYRFDGMFCSQLSHDHSQIQEMKDNGIEDVQIINRNIVTSALIGNPLEPDFKIYTKTISLKNDDIYLICSDGVWECMTIEEMENCLASDELSIPCLYNKVIEAGANDNFSAILLQVNINE